MNSDRELLFTEMLTVVASMGCTCALQDEECICCRAMAEKERETEKMRAHVSPRTMEIMNRHMERIRQQRAQRVVQVKL